MGDDLSASLKMKINVNFSKQVEEKEEEEWIWTEKSMKWFIFDIRIHICTIKTIHVIQYIVKIELEKFERTMASMTKQKKTGH